VDEKSGFRKNHSCETALNLIKANWKMDIEQKNSIVAVFIDLKRAFETTIREMLQWLPSYLTNRGQQTKINGEYSSTKSNDLGIPQGSVLAALLFIIYINDLKKICKKVKINFFADDTLLYVATKNLKEAENIKEEEPESMICSEL
jgi:retron-type reverse transcriptase